MEVKSHDHEDWLSPIIVDTRSTLQLLQQEVAAGCWSTDKLKESSCSFTEVVDWKVKAVVLFDLHLWLCVNCMMSPKTSFTQAAWLQCRTCQFFFMAPRKTDHGVTQIKVYCYKDDRGSPLSHFYFFDHTNHWMFNLLAKAMFTLKANTIRNRFFHVVQKMSDPGLYSSKSEPNPMVFKASSVWLLISHFVRLLHWDRTL